MAEDPKPAPPPVVDPEIRAFIDELMGAGGSGATLPPIGVPEGFAATSPVDQALGAIDPFGLMTVGGGQPVPPRYFDGAEYEPSNLTPAQRADLQDRLVAAGLIPKGADYLKGNWDDVSVGAFHTLLSLSNRHGLTWQQQLTILESTAEENRREQFTAPAYLRPDPAALASNTRGALKALLGRDPTTDEIAGLSPILEGFFRQSHDADVAMARAEFDAEPGTTLSPVQDVDPIARFEEHLRTTYRPEIEMREGTADLSQSRENLMANVFNIDRMIGA